MGQELLQGADGWEDKRKLEKMGKKNDSRDQTPGRTVQAKKDEVNGLGIRAGEPAPGRTSDRQSEWVKQCARTSELEGQTNGELL